MSESHIETRFDSVRGCGWRKAGGKYLVGGELGQPCGKLPFKLDRCPCCGHGIKPACGWTSVGAHGLLGSGYCLPEDCDCESCLLREPPERAGLLWIGGRFYATPESFTREAARLGISRRISQIPKGLVVGETVVLLAHREVAFAWGSEPSPGIFAAFVPRAIEYVVRGDELTMELERLVKQGCTLVHIERRRAEDGSAEGACTEPYLDGPADLRPADTGSMVDRAGDGRAASGSVCEMSSGPAAGTVAAADSHGAAARRLPV